MKVNCGDCKHFERRYSRKVLVQKKGIKRRADKEEILVWYGICKKAYVLVQDKTYCVAV